MVTRTEECGGLTLLLVFSGLSGLWVMGKASAAAGGTGFWGMGLGGALWPGRLLSAWGYLVGGLYVLLLSLACLRCKCVENESYCGGGVAKVRRLLDSRWLKYAGVVG